VLGTAFALSLVARGESGTERVQQRRPSSGTEPLTFGWPPGDVEGVFHHALFGFAAGERTREERPISWHAHARMDLDAIPSEYRGWWRITETSQWSSEFLDSLGPAMLSLTGQADRLRMHCLLAYLSCKPTKTGLSFTWEGAWEYDPMSGSGRVTLGKAELPAEFP
jgi:hypothetical protein